MVNNIIKKNRSSLILIFEFNKKIKGDFADIDKFDSGIYKEEQRARIRKNILKKNKMG